VRKLAASIHVHAAVMHLSANCGPPDDSQDGTGPHPNFGHGNFAGKAARVASVRLYSKVNNYYARVAIGHAYGLRVVDHRGMRPLK
jgi:hypothetical protein